MDHSTPLSSNNLPSKKAIKDLVKQCLKEDIRSGDLTAQLTPADSKIDGKIITREVGIICGIAWVDEVFRRVAKHHKTDIDIEWMIKDGDVVAVNQVLCRFEGLAHPILSYCQAIKHTKTRLLDTRKTLPSMREAQKYAVLCGGGLNHRMGLYDGIIIKENHLRSGKTLEQIVTDAIASVPAGTLVELEVETLDELERGLKAGAKRIMLDDFSLEDMRTAVELTGEQADLEASGNVNINTIASIAETGVDM